MDHSRTPDLAGDLNHLYSFAEMADGEYRDFSRERQERIAQRLQQAAESKPEHSADATPVAEAPAEEATSIEVAAPAVEPEPAPAGVAEKAPEPPAARPQPRAEAPARTWTQLDTTPMDRPTGIAFCSPAGGSGKTTLCANLGHALFAHGEKVLIVDGGTHSLLPLHFGAQPFRAGLRKFCPPGETRSAILLLCGDEPNAAWVAEKVEPAAHDASRTLFDLGSLTDPMIDTVLPLCQIVLIPLTPQVHAELQASRARSIARRWQEQYPALQVYFVLNRLHPGNVAEEQAEGRLRSLLGSQVLPVSIPASDDIAGAIAAQTTIVDLQPESYAAQQFDALAQWLRRIAPPREVAAPTRGWREV